MLKDVLKYIKDEFKETDKEERTIFFKNTARIFCFVTLMTVFLSLTGMNPGVSFVVSAITVMSTIIILDTYFSFSQHPTYRKRPVKGLMLLALIVIVIVNIWAFSRGMLILENVVYALRWLANMVESLG